jgi:hypothetical protein
MPPVPVDAGMSIAMQRMRLAAGLLLLVAPLAGCGLVAAPCRVGSAALKIVPVAGQVAAAPTDGCANAIDPTPTRS